MNYVEIEQVTCAYCGEPMALVEQGYDYNRQKTFLRYRCAEGERFSNKPYCYARDRNKATVTIHVKRPEHILTNADVDEDVIARTELADVLRESPDAPKTALLNRVAGLLKVATRQK